MATTYEQQNVLQDDPPLTMGAWRFVAKSEQMEDVGTTITTICGHQNPHAVRIFLNGAWATFCMDCWRRNRRTYRRPGAFPSQAESLAEHDAPATIRKAFGTPSPKTLPSRGR